MGVREGRRLALTKCDVCHAVVSHQQYPPFFTAMRQAFSRWRTGRIRTLSPWRRFPRTPILTRTAIPRPHTGSSGRPCRLHSQPAGPALSRLVGADVLAGPAQAATVHRRPVRRPRYGRQQPHPVRISVIEVSLLRGSARPTGTPFRCRHPDPGRGSRGPVISSPLPRPWVTRIGQSGSRRGAERATLSPTPQSPRPVLPAWGSAARRATGPRPPLPRGPSKPPYP
jgi:hypothetical protein